LIAIFLIIPWITIKGVPLILFDFPNRHFALFGTAFFAHDAPNLFFIFLSLALGLAFVTAVWGRVWCGWACPQTVFIDGVYRRIEILIEGKYLERRKLRDGDFTFEKLYKTILKWIAFFIVSSFFAHSFAAYFIGSKTLLKMIEQGPLHNLSYFNTISFITGLLLFDFGWFREQFCIIACPYGRFQSVLLDHHSMAVMYDETRGEPRKGLAIEPGQKTGDCVNCLRCVNVCPTGIDIRRGLQMECIACTACIDACDEIMEKVKKPKGLIRYNTLAQKGVKVIRPRTALYGMIIIAALTGLTTRLSIREDFDAKIIRSIEAPYQKMMNEAGQPIIVNHFKVHITNQTSEEGEFEVIPDASWATMGIVLTMPINPVKIDPGSQNTPHFFVKVPATLPLVKGELFTKIFIQNKLKPNSKKIEKELKILGPIN
jgi:cytochrome c oxidase accessory protein FixG